LARVKIKDVPKYKRVDTEKVSSDQRPKDDDYDRYIYLIEVMKKKIMMMKKYTKKFPLRSRILFLTQSYTCPIKPCLRLQVSSKRATKK